MKNLASVCREEQISFIKSFNHVLTDMDGVIWTAYRPLPGAIDCINSLKLLKKKVSYVTNNGTTGEKSLSRKSKSLGLQIEADEIANPILPAISYLKKLNFQSEIFAVGTQDFKDELWASGFRLTADLPQDVEESITGVLEAIKDDENVGAVIFNYDVNLTLIKIQKMLTFLKRKDCLFIVAASDRLVHIGPLGPMIGNQYFLNAIVDISGRKPINVAKPSSHYVEFVKEKFEITDPNKVLLIGDSIIEDMSTAVLGGFQKLLVLTGSTKLEDIRNWKHPIEFQPEYYVESLNVFNDILKSVEKDVECV
ncbi:uncharacterized protein isoform X1 [Leptinotarsa decemlineata]|uniref:uncharacterized protein isoform X1 n=1 Tax=Leptinotarsa decemlineata TaxID=7539 RepID=UPI003D309436